MSDARDFFYIFVIVFRFPAKIRHTLGASKFIGSFQLVSVLNSHIRSHINNLSLGKQKLEASFALNEASECIKQRLCRMGLEPPFRE